MTVYNLAKLKSTIKEIQSVINVDRQIFIFVFVLTDVDMSTKDPRWIGAWWLGFLVFGIMALLVAFPIILFPRKLKEKSENGNDKELPQLIYKDDEIIKDKPKMTKLEVFKGMYMYHSHISFLLKKCEVICTYNL